jgi:hypothetical protein
MPTQLCRNLLHSKHGLYSCKFITEQPSWRRVNIFWVATLPRSIHTRESIGLQSNTTSSEGTDPSDVIFHPRDQWSSIHSHSKHRHGLPFCLVTTMHGYGLFILISAPQQINADPGQIKIDLSLGDWNPLQISATRPITWHHVLGKTILVNFPVWM